MVDANSPEAVIAAYVNKAVTAQLVPVTEMIAGLQLAIAHTFTTLHHKGVLTREAAVASFDKTIEMNKESLPKGGQMVVRQVRDLILEIDKNSPEGRRRRLQLLLEDPEGESPPNSD